MVKKTKVKQWFDGGLDVNIVLHEPEIPANTGNIGRTCVATGTVLHLIEPLGFQITAKELKRAGLDYWDKLDVRIYANFDEFVEKNLKDNPNAKLWLATTKAKRTYAQVSYGEEDFIMFGKESAGIPEEILIDHEEGCVRIPMLDKIRSLNLSNAVGIVLYEALRQNDFKGLLGEGELHRLAWKKV
jgi:tRNA (cytidine/uridine-2'-O-)-methyltransferase